MPDLTGTWLPVASRASDWSPQPLPLTPAGLATMQAFDPNRLDSALFCMPLGTPRNTLATASYPLEILQSADRITLIFPQRSDVRRIYLDGRPHPEDPIPNWAGHSTGKFKGNKLEVDTIGLSSESLLDITGLPHSNDLHLQEQFEFLKEPGGEFLTISSTLTDPVNFLEPLQVTRVFKRIDFVDPGEPTAHCLMDQWRSYLESHNSELRRSQNMNTGEAQP